MELLFRIRRCCKHHPRCSPMMKRAKMSGSEQQHGRTESFSTNSVVVSMTSASEPRRKPTSSARPSPITVAETTTTTTTTTRTQTFATGTVDSSCQSLGGFYAGQIHHFAVYGSRCLDSERRVRRADQIVSIIIARLTVSSWHLSGTGTLPNCKFCPSHRAYGLVFLVVLPVQIRTHASGEGRHVAR